MASVASKKQSAALGPALDKLRGPSATSNPIKLFDLATSERQGNHFQIGTVEASGGDVSMTLIAFRYRWSKQRKNVLFVTWGANELEYWMETRTMRLNADIYAKMRDIVRARLDEQVRALIAEIEL
jgi:hypothetical protein